MKNAKGLIKIALEVIVIDSASDIQNKHDAAMLHNYQEKILKNFESLIETGKHKSREELKFNKKINFKSLCVYDERLVYMEIGRMSKYYNIPAVGFIGNIEFIDFQRTEKSTTQLN